MINVVDGIDWTPSALVYAKIGREVGVVLRSEDIASLLWLVWDNVRDELRDPR